MDSPSTSQPFNDGLDPEVVRILQSRDDKLICVACGTQFAETDRAKLTNCHICDDPRQYVPAGGQKWTTMREIRPSHKNEIKFHSPDLYTLQTTPKFGIGQRAFILKTPGSNVLWDCVTLLDRDTITQLQQIGGIDAIVISHPHFYTNHLLWAAVFDCPVYLASDEKEFLAQPDDGEVERPTVAAGRQDDYRPKLPDAMPQTETGPARVFIEGPVGSKMYIIGRDGKRTGVKAVKIGGHFPGSMVALWEGVGEGNGGRLFVADTLMPTPSGIGERRKGMNSFVFMWSYPNMISLPPSMLASMWTAIAPLQFSSAHAAFPNLDIYASSPAELKQRVWESMLIQVGGEGHDASMFAAANGGVDQQGNDMRTDGGGQSLGQDTKEQIIGGVKEAGDDQVEDVADKVLPEEGMNIESKQTMRYVADEDMAGVVQGGRAVLKGEVRDYA